jgi:hypothetical protein
MINVLISKHHIRYDSVINDKHHIWYDYFHVVLLSYRLPFSRLEDPISGLLGNTVSEPSGRPDGIVGFRTGTGELNGKLF